MAVTNNLLINVCVMGCNEKRTHYFQLYNTHTIELTSQLVSQVDLVSRVHTNISASAGYTDKLPKLKG